MTLFEILSDDQRVLVYSDALTYTLYTWNKSLTLQAWRQHRMDFLSNKDRWEEVDVQTLSNQPEGFGDARSAAINWSVSETHQPTALTHE